jgi:macrolide transport system ATP-binding/permease protein
LERLLDAHRGGFLLVTHDRALLDRVCEGILALENGALTRYTGGWSDYRRVWAERRARAQAEYDQYRAEEKRIKCAIQGAKETRDQVRKTPARMGNSEARLHKRAFTGVQKHLDQARNALESRLEHLDVKQRPGTETQLRASEGVLGGREGVVSETALRLEDLTLCAGTKRLLTHAEAYVPSKGCTALIGPNGCGKSTLLRAILNGREGIRPAPGLRMGYFSQDVLETLDPRRSLLENVMDESVHPQDVARTVLARLGMSARDVQKPAGALSGGERSKCLLVRLMLSQSNFLLLDEPGNALDIYALDALETLLKAYPHGILLVSHDRRMVESTADKVLRFEEERLAAESTKICAQ